MVDDKGRNRKLAAARMGITSPSGSGRVLSRQELADACNAIIDQHCQQRGTRPQCCGMTAAYIGCLERGDIHWPNDEYRHALTTYFTTTETNLGLYIDRPQPALHRLETPDSTETTAHHEHRDTSMVPGEASTGDHTNTSAAFIAREGELGKTPTMHPASTRATRGGSMSVGCDDRHRQGDASRNSAANDTSWETIDLIERIQASDVSLHTLERLEATTFELCCQYPHRQADELHREAQDWLSRVDRLLRKPVGLRQHRELLVSAGWLALLVGCLDYDQGIRSAAEAARVAARQLGVESGHNEIVAWAHEMSAWYALTQGRYGNVITEAEAGQSFDALHSVRVQLLAQEAKALGRMGEIDSVRHALDRGADILSSIPRPYRPEHHFVVDPDKWHFYAMDAYRLAGEDELAQEYAREVLRKGSGSDGTERAPMRMAEARLTLGVVAARSGELEEAVSHSLQALKATRRSVPSLLMIANEADAALGERFPHEERAREEFRNKLLVIGGRRLGD